MNHPTEAQLCWYVDRVLCAGESDRDGILAHTNIPCHPCARRINEIVIEYFEEGE